MYKRKLDAAIEDQIKYLSKLKLNPKLIRRRLKCVMSKHKLPTLIVNLSNFIVPVIIYLNLLANKTVNKC